MARMALGVVIGLRAGVEEKLRRLQEAGFTTLQTYLAIAEWREDPGRCRLKQLLADTGFHVTSVAVGYPGESYADIEAVRKTVGLVPPETRAERMEHTKYVADWAHEMGAPFISCHIGFITEDRYDPEYHALVAALQELCDYLQEREQGVNLETGQETAELLLEFIHDVNRPNLGVNFDPANMILYGTGDPIEALGILGPWVRGVHCKDGNWPTAAGQLGEEQRLGEGQVGLPRFIAKLVEVGYEGPLTVEREISEDLQMADFSGAGELLKGIKKDLGVA